MDITIPAAGESVREAMIARWLKKNGDFVKTDEPILEIETDKATLEVLSPGTGTLNILEEAGKALPIGTLVGQLALSEAASPPPQKPEQKTQKPEELLSPIAPSLQQKVINQGLDLSELRHKPGTGPLGVLTQEDLEISPSPFSTSKEKFEKNLTASTVMASPGTRREPLSMMRRKISERLLESQRNTATLTTFNDIHMGPLLELKAKNQERVQKEHGIKLGIMGVVLKACSMALQRYPSLNAQIEGDDIIYNEHCHIGVAVSTDKGLVVPVIRQVENLSVLSVEKAIAQFAEKSRNHKISMEDLSGGTFTVSNGGVFGSLFSTPILNPPQSAILGMHKIQKRVVVDEQGNMVVRPMMYAALSYDHRLIDGREAVSFLMAVKEMLEDPSRILLEV